MGGVSFDQKETKKKEEDSLTKILILLLDIH